MNCGYRYLNAIVLELALMFLPIRIDNVPNLMQQARVILVHSQHHPIHKQYYTHPKEHHKIGLARGIKHVGRINDAVGEIVIWNPHVAYVDPDTQH